MKKYQRLNEIQVFVSSFLLLNYEMKIRKFYGSSD